MQRDDLFGQDYYATSDSPSTHPHTLPHPHPTSHPHRQSSQLYASDPSAASLPYDAYELGGLNDAALQSLQHSQNESLEHRGIGEAEQDDAGEDDEESPETVTSDGKRKRSGRPRDKVWELFEGDRVLASCRFCDWKSEHPKAFRMRAHVQACERIPLEKKQQHAQYEQDKVRNKQLQQELALKQQTVSAEVAAAVRANIEKKKAAAEEAASAGSTGSPSGAGGPSAAKKQKKDHIRSGAVQQHGGPPPLQSPYPNQRMAPSSNQQSGSKAPPPRSPITCHVLDSTSGKPAPDMRIRLDRLNTTGFVLQGQGMTDKDGRCNSLLPPGTVLEVGIFKITFFTSEYFTHRGILSFYPFVEIPFEVKSPEEHYHIPCLLSPYSYTTYRGS
ncbi:hydroxyisourate hydrolase [Sporobolomyces koalae]|uniref:hydroxyisourate hydrolase n=1 Tax=Sporobolomyces koalae TaxID=500713 RepID=UPI003173D823